MLLHNKLLRLHTILSKAAFRKQPFENILSKTAFRKLAYMYSKEIIRVHTLFMIINSCTGLVCSKWQ